MLGCWDGAEFLALISISLSFRFQALRRTAYIIHALHVPLTSSPPSSYTYIRPPLFNDFSYIPNYQTKL